MGWLVNQPFRNTAAQSAYAAMFFHRGDQFEIRDIRDSRAVAIGRGSTAVYQGLSVEEVAMLVVELKHKDQPAVWDGRIPYLGLKAYQESDAEFFFGREADTQQLVDKVSQSPFVAVIGASGSGKSSVVRAGLISSLKSNALPGSREWTYLAPIVPGSAPLDNLAQVLPEPVNDGG